MKTPRAKHSQRLWCCQKGEGRPGSWVFKVEVPALRNGEGRYMLYYLVRPQLKKQHGCGQGKNMRCS